MKYYRKFIFKGEIKLNCYEIQEYYNKCRYNYAYNNSNFGIFFNEVPVSTDFGYIEIHITKNLGQEIATDAVLTIYVNQNGNQIPVISLSPTQNPTIIELPIAHPEGTLVESPEYYFTPYSLTIESEGYYRIVTQNIRLFPNVKAIFFYNLNEIVSGQPNHEEITIFPPHPRDEI